MIIPTLTPIRARKTSNNQILSTKKAPAPERTYKESPASANARVFIRRKSQGKTRFVRMIRSFMLMVREDLDLKVKELYIQTVREDLQDLMVTDHFVQDLMATDRFVLMERDVQCALTERTW